MLLSISFACALSHTNSLDERFSLLERRREVREQEDSLGIGDLGLLFLYALQQGARKRQLLDLRGLSFLVAFFVALLAALLVGRRLEGRGCRVWGCQQKGYENVYLIFGGKNSPLLRGRRPLLRAFHG